MQTLWIDGQEIGSLSLELDYRTRFEWIVQLKKPWHESLAPIKQWLASYEDKTVEIRTEKGTREVTGYPVAVDVQAGRYDASVSLRIREAA